MHIADFTNTYLPTISGVVRSVSLFRQALTDLGHNVFVFAQHADNYEDQEPFIFRYPSIQVHIPADFPITIPISPFIDELLPLLKLDVIHAHHPVLLGRTAVNKAQKLGLPLVFTFHSQYREYSRYIPFPQEKVQEFIKDLIENSLAEFIRECQHVIVPTESMRDALVEAYGLDDRLTVVPTGIDLRPYQDVDGQLVRAQRGWGRDPVLVSVGRLAPEKNWRTLLDAVAQVMRTHSDLRFALVGDGPERQALQEYTKELQIDRRVDLVGQVPMQDVPLYLKAADLFGFASVTETQGLVTMEAMAAGLPVVAVKAIGTCDVIEHDKEGLLTENDSTALASAIRRVLDDEALRQRYRTAALERSRSFDIIHQARRLIEVYRQAIEDKRANRTVTVIKHERSFKLIGQNRLVRALFSAEPH